VQYFSRYSYGTLKSSPFALSLSKGSAS
jgi:hypothetical protein